MEKQIQHRYDSYPEHIKPLMNSLRDLVFKVADNTEGVGEITEALKWGEPSFLTSKPKSGTTIRIDWKSRSPELIGIYVSCSTSLIESFRTMFSDVLSFEGNRAILIPISEPIPEKELSICIQMALRYHLDKK